MKKLISVLALAALVCGAAFADVTMTDWEPFVYGSTLSITDYEPAGFDVELSEWVNSAALDVETHNVSGWLYDPNVPITVTLSGFDNDAFIASDNTWLMLEILNWDENRYADYELPFTGAYKAFYGCTYNCAAYNGNSSSYFNLYRSFI